MNLSITQKGFIDTLNNVFEKPTTSVIQPENPGRAADVRVADIFNVLKCTSEREFKLVISQITTHMDQYRLSFLKKLLEITGIYFPSFIRTTVEYMERKHPDTEIHTAADILSFPSGKIISDESVGQQVEWIFWEPVHEARITGRSSLIRTVFENETAKNIWIYSGGYLGEFITAYLWRYTPTPQKWKEMWESIDEVFDSLGSEEEKKKIITSLKYIYILLALRMPNEDVKEMFYRYLQVHKKAKQVNKDDRTEALFHLSLMIMDLKKNNEIFTQDEMKRGERIEGLEDLLEQLSLGEKEKKKQVLEQEEFEEEEEEEVNLQGAPSERGESSKTFSMKHWLQTKYSWYDIWKKLYYRSFSVDIWVERPPDDILKGLLDLFLIRRPEDAVSTDTFNMTTEEFYFMRQMWEGSRDKDHLDSPIINGWFQDMAHPVVWDAFLSWSKENTPADKACPRCNLVRFLKYKLRSTGYIPLIHPRLVSYGQRVCKTNTDWFFLLTFPQFIVKPISWETFIRKLKRKYLDWTRIIPGIMQQGITDWTKLGLTYGVVVNAIYFTLEVRNNVRANYFEIDAQLYNQLTYMFRELFGKLFSGRVETSHEEDEAYYAIDSMLMSAFTVRDKPKRKAIVLEADNFQDETSKKELKKMIKKVNLYEGNFRDGAFERGMNKKPLMKNASQLQKIKKLSSSNESETQRELLKERMRKNAPPGFVFVAPSIQSYYSKSKGRIILKKREGYYRKKKTTTSN